MNSQTLSFFSWNYIFRFFIRNELEIRKISHNQFSVLMPTVLKLNLYLPERETETSSGLYPKNSLLKMREAQPFVSDKEMFFFEMKWGMDNNVIFKICEIFRRCLFKSGSCLTYFRHSIVNVIEKSAILFCINSLVKKLGTNVALREQPNAFPAFIFYMSAWEWKSKYRYVHTTANLKIKTRKNAT